MFLYIETERETLQRLFPAECANLKGADFQPQVAMPQDTRKALGYQDENSKVLVRWEDEDEEARLGTIFFWDWRDEGITIPTSPEQLREMLKGTGYCYRTCGSSTWVSPCGCEWETTYPHIDYDMPQTTPCPCCGCREGNAYLFDMHGQVFCSPQHENAVANSYYLPPDPISREDFLRKLPEEFAKAIIDGDVCLSDFDSKYWDRMRDGTVPPLVFVDGKLLPFGTPSGEGFLTRDSVGTEVRECEDCPRTCGCKGCSLT